MNTTAINFNGGIPQNYEDYLTPFLFDPYAEDLMERINFTSATHVLELAAGTGIVTKKLIHHLPSGAHLTATDLQADMLAIAKNNNVLQSNVTWNTVDMTNIPYEDDSFDLIVCQFGLMLVPDKQKALAEMYRVLRKGGKLWFSVWGNMEDNAVWNIGGKVLSDHLNINPILQNPGPFSMSDIYKTLELLKASGFENAVGNQVKKTGEIESAALAAKGFIQGLPVVMAISQKNPELVPKIQNELELELINQIGNHPLRSPLHALVFEATK